MKKITEEWITKSEKDKNVITIYTSKTGFPKFRSEYTYSLVKIGILTGCNFVNIFYGGSYGFG
jgi:hypothetical protein